MKLVIACVLAGSLVTAGIALWILQYDIGWLRDCEAGLAARENCNFTLAEEKLLSAASAASHFSRTDYRRYSIDLALAQMYIGTGNFSRAKEFLDSARSFADAENNVQYQLSVMSLHGDWLYRQAQFEEAGQVFATMRELARKNGQTIFEIDAQFALIKMDIMAMNREDAEARIQQVESLHPKLKAPSNVELVLSVYTCQIAELKGRYKTARMLFEGAENLAKIQTKPTSALRLSIANNNCSFLLQERNFTRAKNIGQRAFENCEKNFESYFAGNRLHALRNMTTVCLAENDNRRARHFVDIELEETGKRLSHDHPYYGIALEHRAIVENREGKKEESERDFKASLEIFEKSLGAANRFTAQTLIDIAKIQYEAKDFQSSVEGCKRAIAIYRARLPYDHPSALAGLMILAQNYRNQNKLALAHALDVEASEGIGAADGK